MCGIVGYAGDRDIGSVLLVGLERLSYRGYDSSGIAVISNNELSWWKKEGKLQHLKTAIEPLSLLGSVGIGHTRWATHGKPNQYNAHPHIATTKKMAVVHNGIIENYLSLKRALIEKGHIFRSETDSEVIIQLIESLYSGDMIDAINQALKMLTGTFAISIISEDDPGKMYAIRKDSPLILGIGDHETFVASDLNAITPHTKSIVYLDDNEMAILDKHSYKILNSEGKEITKPIHTIKWDSIESNKDGYDHFMLKEIHEQPTVVRRILNKFIQDSSISFKHLNLTDEEIMSIRRFIIQACGTSWHAGFFAKYIIERFARILTEVDISSEFRYREMIADSKDMVIAISQSGETADTLACIREAKSKFYKILSFVNVKNSSISRESDSVVYSHSGQEIGVASTKNYIAQLLSLLLFSIYTAKIKQTFSSKTEMTLMDALKKLPDQIQSLLNKNDEIKEIARKYHTAKNFIFIGRGINYPSALEGALKLKEISYIHATGYAAGELKHGPIALIDEDVPIVCISPKTSTYSKMISNIEEVRARKGRTIVIASQGDDDILHHAEDVIYIPNTVEELTPILVAIPLQLLAYHIAILLNCDVDQPRNLAKSVTVE